MDILSRFKTVIDEHLDLATSPIAIKLLERREDVPINMGRPLRDLGEPITPCAGWHFVRRQGVCIAMLEEDFSTVCPLGVFIFGILEPIRSWIEGDLAYGIYAGSREAAANMERNVFRLEVGKYKGIALAPLGKVDFIPDIVMIYCNSLQALRLVSAAAWTTGEPLKISMAGRALGSDGIVQSFQTRQPVLSIPCGGDRKYGLTQDNEIVFTTPMDRLEGIIKGLEGFKRSHSIENLGEDTMIYKRYTEMAKKLDEKLGR